MYCPSCGKEHKESNRFCVECGAPIPKDSSSGSIQLGSEAKTMLSNTTIAESTVTDKTAPAQYPDSSSLKRGIIGACLGGLVCIGLVVVANFVSYISDTDLFKWFSLFGGYLILDGYENFGKAIDTKGVICSIVVFAVSVFVGWVIGIAMYIYFYCGAQQYGLSFLDVLLNLNYLLGSDLTWAVRDLLITYVLTALGAGGLIWKAHKRAQRLKR